MKIVIIGGNGLIGQRLVSILGNAGHEVIAASRRTGIDLLTGAGLAETLAGAEILIDVTNPPVFEPKVVQEFFATAGHHIQNAIDKTTLQHHVVLSVVGADDMPDNFYMHAKVVQEQLVQAGSVPYTIVRATQFFEFIEAIALTSIVDGVVQLPETQFQPLAADDVAELVAAIALAKPTQGILDIAGPDLFTMQQAVQMALTAKGNSLPVTTSPQATYFGSLMKHDSLIPTRQVPQLGKQHLDQWLKSNSST